MNTAKQHDNSIDAALWVLEKETAIIDYFAEISSNDDYSEAQISELTIYLETLRKGKIYSKAHTNKIALWLLSLTKMPIATQSELRQLGDNVIRSLKLYDKATKNTATHQTIVTSIIGKQWQQAYTKAVNDEILPKRRDKPTGYIIAQVYEILYRECGIDADAGIIRKILTLLNVDFRDNRIYEHLSPENRKRIRESVTKRREAAYSEASKKATSQNTPTDFRQPETTNLVISTSEAITRVKEILNQINDPEIAESLIFAIDEALQNFGDIEY
ncbi:hypothetical protein QDY72_06365 [Kingella negevensis]|uniref:hypothetical protein n=1 Tax=Kingella negevensis TaxID=1522312 RepID=UPI00254BBE11|nr:hypothetical protein [Kingella negevensis]MDK4684803.1 hypothetical protein [Kingella negevensis]MDK4707344.1 hypothetical protein [Kingella negevensis]MDK4710178.1 hypothetical protein [Kingella negevensis]